MNYVNTPNIEKIISSKNAKVLLKDLEEVDKKECSCPKNKICPMGGKCLNKNIIYNAEITSNNEVNNYIGLCSTSFKSRLSVHKQSFKNSNINQTSLSKHIIKLQREKIEYSINWKIIDRGRTFSPISNNCQLCTKEAYHIIFNPELSNLNSRNEIFNSCRHRKGALLINST